MTGRYCSCARGADWRQRTSHQKIFLEKIFLNACVGNVFAVSQSCDSCRIHGHLLHDRAPIAHDTTQNILDRKSTRLNSSHVKISYAVFCLKKKKK